MGSTRPMWVGLDLCDGLGWIEFFLTHHGGLGQKIPLTQLNPTHAHPYPKAKANVTQTLLILPFFAYPLLSFLIKHVHHLPTQLWLKGFWGLTRCLD